MTKICHILKLSKKKIIFDNSFNFLFIFDGFFKIFPKLLWNYSNLNSSKVSLTFSRNFQKISLKCLKQKNSKIMKIFLKFLLYVHIFNTKNLPKKSPRILRFIQFFFLKIFQNYSEIIVVSEKNWHSTTNEWHAPRRPSSRVPVPGTDGQCGLIRQKPGAPSCFVPLFGIFELYLC